MQEPSSAASLAWEEIGTEDEPGGVILADLRSLFRCLRFLDGDGNSQTVGGRILSWFQIQGQSRAPGARRRGEGRGGATGVAEPHHVYAGWGPRKQDREFLRLYFSFTVGPNLSCQNSPMIPRLGCPNTRSPIKEGEGGHEA